MLTCMMYHKKVIFTHDVSLEIGDIACLYTNIRLIYICKSTITHINIHVYMYKC